jgi:hypothetical protein
MECKLYHSPLAYSLFSSPQLISPLIIVLCQKVDESGDRSVTIPMPATIFGHAQTEKRAQTFVNSLRVSRNIRYPEETLNSFMSAFNLDTYLFSV